MQPVVKPWFACSGGVGEQTHATLHHTRWPQAAVSDPAVATTSSLSSLESWVAAHTSAKWHEVALSPISVAVSPWPHLHCRLAHCYFGTCRELLISTWPDFVDLTASLSYYSQPTKTQLSS